MYISCVQNLKSDKEMRNKQQWRLGGMWSVAAFAGSDVFHATVDMSGVAHRPPQRSMIRNISANNYVDLQYCILLI